MSETWRGAEPPEAEAFGLRGRLRFWARGAAAAAWTGALFGAYLALRVVDAAVAAIVLRPVRGLAPGVVRIWAGGALALLGLRVRRAGAPMAQPGAVVANHSSWLDILALQRTTSVFFVSKAEVARWPGIGLLARGLGTVFIERRAVEAQRQGEALRARLRRGDRLCLFPEGTSTDGRQVLAFKSALFDVFLDPDLREGMWVQPVSIVYRAPEGAPAALYAWWGDMEFGAHLAGLLARPWGGVVEVRFHRALRAADFASRKALAAAAGAAVRAGCAAPVEG